MPGHFSTPQQALRDKNASDKAGFHRWTMGGSFEVFWDDTGVGEYGWPPRNYNAYGTPVEPGWYWWACWPGCLPDGDAIGPFATSQDAFNDAD